MYSKQKNQKGKPEWVSSFADQDRYKLSQAELMQKKISLMSKHRMEAKDQWQQVQEKLKNNVMDDDTQKIYLTALHSKGLNNSTSKRRNLTQMIEWEKSERAHSQSQFKPDILEQAKMLLLESERGQQNQDPNFLSKIKQDLEETKSFVAKAQRLKKPEKILKAEQEKSIDKGKQETKKSITKQNQVAEGKCQTQENYGFNGMKNLDNVISFLENTLHSQEVQISSLKEENPFRNAALTDTKTVYSEIPNFSVNNTQNKFYQKEENCFAQQNIENMNQEVKEQNVQYQNKENDFTNSRIQKDDFSNLNQSEIPKNDIPKYEQFKKDIMKIEEQQPTHFVQQRLNFDKVCFTTKNELSFDDNIDQLRQLLEQTRQELNQMNLQDSTIMEYNNSQREINVQLNQTEPLQQKHINYQKIHRKYKNCDTFDINDHLM
ncbi:unnamed protein product (macronuclear) [Paramecium tetraurelia]|uniref:Uncharacterized protein n=1 Tax=Paramecium tetraurelia TaxID=5888 RepID=A0BZS1_PARTE|nr:uncharacterized protein GSPATT00005890001 [Paramecium tetraurelia]CAK64038.1 unnamed protein product [Paramecium tetraurelia]|eukprot:XP_001431436.1 hypothetical protein (macronuclear) [Paramecium tetraurelia strain d4-2]